VAVELKAMARTADPSAITVGADGRVIVQLREDGLGFIETLPLENTSDKLFDATPGGVEIPLPKAAVGVEGANGEHKIEVRKGVGVAVHGPIPPRRATAGVPGAKSPDEVTFGFVIPVNGNSLDFEQPMPRGMGEFTFITDQIPGLTVDSKQITGARQERELNGKRYWLWRGLAVPPGGTLRFTLEGLPSSDRTGQAVAGALALALALAAVVVAGRGGGGGRGSRAAAESEREKLVQRREKLFAELMALDGRREAQPAAVAANAGAERGELVRKLEGVYRELTALDERLGGA
jgi:hypothetical protein